MTVNVYKTHKVQVGEELFKILGSYLPKLEEKSIVAITSKIVAIAHGDVVKDDGMFTKDELVKQEADYYLEYDVDTPYGKIFLTRKNNLLVFAAGIDKSNSDGYYVLWPKHLQETTNKIWEHIRNKHQLENVGVIITDSRLIPSRTGVVGFGLSWCGFNGLNDFVGKPDIYGHPITMTKVNLVESLATSAVVVMGETNEQTPLAVIQEVPFVQFQNRIPTQEELDAMSWPVEKDMYGKLLTSVEWKKGRKMKIKPALISDYEQLMQLYNLFVGSDRYSKHDNDSFKKVLDNPQNFVYVAVDRNKLVGFATFSIRNVVRYPRPIAELDELFVHEAYRQKGIGKAFMKIIEDKARELHCYRMYIESNYNYKSGHKFYESLRYTNYGYHFIKNL